MLFDRICALSVGAGGSIGARLVDLRTQFSVVKTEDAEPNDVSVRIYNVAATTRAALETAGNRVVIEAGYRSTGLSVLAIGDIVRGATDHRHPDIVTTAEAKDGGIALRNARVSATYEPGTAAKTIVEDLLRLLDVDRVEITADLAGTFRSAWSCYGNVRDALDKLARRFQFSWSVQNNTAQVTPFRAPSLRSAVVLSPATGLVGIPSRLDKTGGNQDKAKEEPGLAVRCLLNPAILPGDPIVIESADFPRATYRVRRVEHAGDTHGRSWHSDVEAVSVNE